MSMSNMPETLLHACTRYVKRKKKKTFNFKYVFRYFNNCFFLIKTYKKNYHGIFTINK